MISWLTLALSAISGVVLGVVFFGGLWWTVQKALASPTPARWFLGSLLLRMGIVLPGLYFVSAGNWDRLLACLLGMTLARIAVTQLTQPRITMPNTMVNRGQPCT